MKLDELLDEKTAARLFGIFDNRKLNGGTYLGLKGKQISDGDIPYLCEYLKHNQAIEALELNHNNIGPDGAIFFAENNSTINWLRIDDNKIGDDGCDALITHHKYLTHLNVSINNISDRGVSNIHLNTTLESLYLSYNSITDKGAVYLSRNSTLQTLVLRINAIGDLGASALESNQNLGHVDIFEQKSEKPASSALNDSLLKLCRRNNNLKENYLKNVKSILLEWIYSELAIIILQYKDKDIVPIYCESIHNRIIAQLPRPAEQVDTQFNKDLKTVEAGSKTTEKLLSKSSPSDDPSHVSSNSQTFINRIKKIRHQIRCQQLKNPYVQINKFNI